MDEQDLIMIATLWGKIINAQSREEYESAVFEFALKSQQGQIDELVTSMLLSTATLAKKAEIDAAETKANVDAIMMIFKPDAKMVDNKDDLKEEDNFKDNNVVDLASRRKE